MRGDINLLPNKKASDSTKLASGFIASAILVIIFSAVFMVYIPNMDKKEIEKQIATKEAELATYTTTQGEYIELVANLNLLRDRISAFDNINYTNLHKSKVLNDVEAAIPTKIIVSSFSITENVMNIVGSTTMPNPVLISQFMINLRNIEKVSNVILGSVSNTEGSYSFSLTVYYSMEVPEELSPESEDATAFEQGSPEEGVE